MIGSSSSIISHLSGAVRTIVHRHGNALSRKYLAGIPPLIFRTRLGLNCQIPELFFTKKSIRFFSPWTNAELGWNGTFFRTLRDELLRPWPLVSNPATHVASNHGVLPSSWTVPRLMTYLPSTVLNLLTSLVTTFQCPTLRNVYSACWHILLRKTRTLVYPFPLCQSPINNK